MTTIISESNESNDKPETSLYEYLLQSNSGMLIMKHLKELENSYEKDLLLDLVDDAIKTNCFALWEVADYAIIIKSFKSDELKLKYLKYLSDECSRYEIIISLEHDDSKIKGLEYLKEKYYAASVVRTFKDEYKMIDQLSKFTNYYQEMIIENITSNKILKELYHQVTDNMRVFVLKNMADDNFKYQELNNYSLNEQLQILKTFRDQKLLIQILREYRRYQPYIVQFVNVITDQDFLLKLFDNCQIDLYCLNIINRINDETIKRKLISRLKNEFYKIALESNYNDKKQELVKQQDVNNIRQDIDQAITIGLELEVCADDWNTVLTLKNILQDWQIVWDVSVQKGVEFVSPILRFCPQDLQTLKFVCNLLEEHGFYPDDSCGGHIHFGFDYFKTVAEFNVFLNLYGNVEDILYLISNRSGSRIRSRVLKYAEKLQPLLVEVSKLEIDWNKCQELGKYVKLITQGISTKYYGLNLQNVNSVEKNTLEFRMPNGEVNFDEIILNIRLFAKLMEKSKEIAQLQTRIARTSKEIKHFELYNKLVSRELDDRTKVSYLLNILFDNLEERNLYYKRYVNNLRLNPQSSIGSKKILYLKK